MSIHLNPGDRVQFIQNGRRLKFIVDENFMDLRTRGEDTQIPLRRLIKTRKNTCNIDRPSQSAKPPKVRWIARSLLRKLPKSCK